MTIVAAALFLFFPALLVFLAQKLPVLDRIGLVVLAFGCGIAVAAGVDLKNLFNGSDVQSVQVQITEISIALAIPLLVMSMDVAQSLKLARASILSMVFAIVSVVGFAIVLSGVFASEIDYMWQVAAMSVGAYVGGGPNMAAIKVAIDGDQTVFMTMATYDVLLSAMYLIFVMTAAKPLFQMFLPNFQGDNSESAHEEFEHLSDDSAKAFNSVLQSGRKLESLLSIIASGVAVAGGVALASIAPESIASSATIIAITTLGLIFSFIPKLRALKNSFQVGMYLVLVFCFTMGAMTDIEMLKQLNVALFSYIALIMIGALCLHCILCKVFKIDVDTFLIASSAAIMSVPFIPVVAGALKNRALIVPGFAIAILGYILGNYLGVLTAFILK